MPTATSFGMIGRSLLRKMPLTAPLDCSDDPILAQRGRSIGHEQGRSLPRRQLNSDGAGHATLACALRDGIDRTPRLGDLRSWSAAGRVGRTRSIFVPRFYVLPRRRFPSLIAGSMPLWLQKGPNSCRRGARNESQKDQCACLLRAAHLRKMRLGRQPGPVFAGPQAHADNEIETLPPDQPGPPAAPCVLPKVPLRELLKPRRKRRDEGPHEDSGGPGQ